MGHGDAHSSGCQTDRQAFGDPTEIEVGDDTGWGGGSLASDHPLVSTCLN